MRTTLSNKTVKFLREGEWSPEMSFDQFAKVAPDLNNVSQVVVQQYLTRDEAEKLKEHYLLTQHNSEV